MNQEQLLDVFRRASDVFHDSTSDSTTKTKVRKNAVLAELESAHLLMYQHRAEQAIQARLDRQSQQKENKKEKESREYSNLEKIIAFRNNNPKIIEFYFGEPKPKSSDVSTRRNMAFNLAQTAVHQDQGLVRFRQRLDRLESAGDDSTLESLLNAAHNVSV